MLASSSVAAQLAASQEGLSFMKLVSCISLQQPDKSSMTEYSNDCSQQSCSVTPATWLNVPGTQAETQWK
jgi:hypothetical protein